MGFVRDKATGKIKWTNESTTSGLFKEHNYNPSNDEYIQNLANQLKGTEYGDLLSANPYGEDNYKLSFWDKVGNFFGFNTYEDRHKLEMQQLSRQWASQIPTIKREEEYNSPLAQAQRMRAAGQNPDLLGTGGVAPASEMTESEGMPNYEGMLGEGMQNLQNFGQSIFGIINGAFGLAEKFQNFEIMKNEMEFKTDTNARTIAEVLLPNYYKELGDEGIKKLMEGDDSYRGDIEAAIKRVLPEVGIYPKNKRKREAFMNRVSDYLGNLAQTPENAEKYYKSMNSALKEKLGAGQTMGTWGFDLNTSMEDVITITEEINKCTKEIETFMKKYERDYWNKKDGGLTAETENDIARTTQSTNAETREYNDAHDATLQGETENEENKTRKAKATIDNIINECLERIVNDMEKRAKKGDFFATTTLYSAVLSRFFQTVGGGSPTGISAITGIASKFIK